MDTLIHADIFFFITAIAVVVVGVVFGIAGVYIILILRSVRKIVRRAEQETSLWQDEFAVLRDAFRTRIERISTLFDGLTGIFREKDTEKGRRRKKT